MGINYYLTYRENSLNINITPYGDKLLFNLLRYNLKSGVLHFLKVFYHKEIMGWTSGFLKIMDRVCIAFEMTSSVQIGQDHLSYDNTLRKLLRVLSVISVNSYYISVLWAYL